MKEEFIFYFGMESPFSHWYKCNFVVDSRIFCCVEQYLMYKKAVLFSDSVIAGKILRSTDPKRHHHLGKQVHGFNKLLWQKHCKKYAFDGNYAKFTQQARLLKLLQDTSGKSLAEASPYDRNWGVGLSMMNPKIYERKNWRGKNWAGEALESVRKNIIKQSKSQRIYSLTI